ncbi:MAG: signal peptidase II [Clostridiales bacterium]|nr:signal peptidase II [Clostridiales bacterium]
MKLKNKNIWCTVMMIAIVSFDQVTKYLAKTYLYQNDSVVFIDNFIEFTYAENTGIAFSMLSGGRWFLIILTGVLIVGLLFVMFTKTGQRNLWLFWSLGVLVSGAFGNLIDRVFLGYVIDFINPLFVNFAVFNIADCAVTLGSVSLIAYLIYDVFKKEKKDEQDT